MTPDPELVEKVAAKCEFSKMAEDKKPHQEHAEIMFRKGERHDSPCLSFASIVFLGLILRKFCVSCLCMFSVNLCQD